MNFYKINEKTVSREKIVDCIDKILTMRSMGHSQAEVASYFNMDRTFISRLENLGEIRKGKSVALVGFPISNTDEIKNLAKKYGVNYIFILNEKERWQFLMSKTGVELFDQLIEIVRRIREYDIVIVVGSDTRIKIIESLLDSEVIGLNIGESPLRKDVDLDANALDNLLQNLV